MRIPNPNRSSRRHLATASAIPYGSGSQGQYLIATSATTAEWGYGPWDTTTVTAVAGANAGTSPPAPVVPATATIYRGSLTCGTGGSAATGALVAVTFGITLPNTPFVLITPTTSALAALTPAVTTISTTGFTVSVTSPSSSQAATVYGLDWLVVV